ncbi:MAG: septum formation inhibitor Maf [Gammaproteobacteria bacterium]|nr:MAG: septum formation inhibitor Maf [Gammaproteobacteria bacterium]RTZ75922.1 MAG: septum formation inhibitor Maf [Gammaproteobacteria bacterium]
MLPLVLASTSPYRAQLLEKLGLPFETASPEVDERRHEHESPVELVRRLAEAKARAVRERFPAALIIGSDQVACVEEEILGKPGSEEKAIAQLLRMRGRRVTFHTGLCLFNSAEDRVLVSCEDYHVHFRELNKHQVRRYVEKEQPFDCAGSFKSEGYGITLFSRLEGDDPNSLVGLPLIRLVEMLGVEGIELP